MKVITMKMTNVSSILAAVTITAFSSTASLSEEIGEVGVDWFGNDIIIEAIPDPKVQGVTCHVAYFERGIIDRLQKGNWFEDPSNSSIECRQTAPITVGDIELDKDGEEIFKSSRSLIWKKLVVKRIFDKKNNSLVYLAHSREVQSGSAKMSISVVPIFQPKTIDLKQAE